MNVEGSAPVIRSGVPVRYRDYGGTWHDGFAVSDVEGPRDRMFDGCGSRSGRECRGHKKHDFVGVYVAEAGSADVGMFWPIQDVEVR